MTNLNKPSIEINEKQRQVIDETDRNVIMLASAGTGKTNTLAQRVNNIIYHKYANPDEILCITFTNRACKEMKDRVISVVGSNGQKVAIKTIHSFCYEIIKSQAKEKAERYSDFVILDEMDCLEIIKLISKDIKIKPETVQHFIELVKTNRALLDIFTGDEHRDFTTTLNEIFTKDKQRLLKLCYKQGETDSSMLKTFLDSGAMLVCKYNMELREMNALDFDDLLIMAYVQLKEPKAREFWSKRYKYISVDEVQDVNILEYNILDIVFGENNVLICGDYFQTIYEWRGSRPNKLLLRHINKYKPVEIVLHQNYRATKKLVNATFETLINLFGNVVFEHYSEGVTAESKHEGENIALYPAFNINAEAQWILGRIREINADDISKICILTRNNGYCTELSGYLNGFTVHDDKLDFMVVDEFRFFRRAEIKDLLAFIKLFTNKYDTVSLKRILKKYTKGIGEKTVEEICSDEYAENGIRLTDFLEKGSFTGLDPFSDLLNCSSDIVIFDVESTGLDTVKDEIIQIAAIKLDKNMNVKSKFVKFIKPSKIVGKSQNVHGFSDEFLSKNGREAKSVLPEFLSYSDNCIVVGHNVNYDINILTSQLLRNGLAKPRFIAVYDTLDIYRRYFPNLKEHKLEYLSNYFSLKHKSSHDASDDIEATRELLVIALDKFIKPSEHKRKELIGRHIHKFEPLFKFVNKMTEKVYQSRPETIVRDIINDTKIRYLYERKGELKRVDNIDYFLKLSEKMDDKSLNPKDAIMSLLSLASLSNSELDILLQETQKIPIITVHQAKGMEFDYVFLAGMQQRKFPSYMSLIELKNGNIENFNEEKRVFYVAITRAKKSLSISYASNIGRYNYAPSEFISRIPDNYINIYNHDDIL